MNKYESAVKQLQDGVKTYVDTAIKNAPMDKTMTGIITVANENGTYAIKINNQVYNNVNTIGGTCTIGEIVKVVIPQNNYNNMFILKGGDNGGSGGVTDYADLTNKPKINNITLQGGDNDPATLGLATVTQLNQKADSATTIAGYGITDAKIENGAIILGADSITPLTSESTLDASKVSGTLPPSTYIDTTYEVATQSTDGLMSASDKTKLDGIENGAEKNTVLSVNGMVGNVTITDNDTLNTAGATSTTDKIYLVGGKTQTNNPQTYTDDEIYAQNGILHASNIQLGDNNTNVMTTEDVSISNGTITLNNDSISVYSKNEIDNKGFITKTVSDLTNYYLKTETYTQTEINNLISAIPKFRIIVLENESDFPPDNPQENTVYLVPTTETEIHNLYVEYIYVNNNWEKLGEQTIDLEGYWYTDPDDITQSNLYTNNNDKTIVFKYPNGTIVNYSPVFTVNGNSGTTITLTLADLAGDSTHRTVTDTQITNWNNKSDTDTLDTAGSLDVSDNLYLIGAKTQSSSAKTYSNADIYINGTTNTLNAPIVQSEQLVAKNSTTNYTLTINNTSLILNDTQNNYTLTLPQNKNGTLALTSDLEVKLVLTGRNLNDYKSTGMWHFIVTPTNIPTGDTGTLIVYAYGLYAKQIWYCSGTNNGETYVRQYSGGGGWSSWQRYAMVNDIPTKLSDLVDDVVSGNYLPLSGGTLTGLLGSNVTNNNTSMFEHYNINGDSVAKLNNYNDTYEILRLGEANTEGILRLQNGSNSNYGQIRIPTVTDKRTYYLPDASGTVALTSDIDEELAINMVKYPYYTSSGTTDNYITYTYGEDGIITMTGTANGLSDFFIVALQDKVEISPSTTYTFSGISGGSDSTYFIRLTTYDSNSSSLGNVDFYDATTVTTPTNAKYMRLAIYVRSGVTVNETISPMLEKGDTAHSYKRYCGEGETLNSVLANNFDILDGCQKQLGSTSVSTTTYTVPSETSTSVCTLPLSKGINIIRVGVSVPNSVTNTDFTMTFNATAGSETVATGTSEHQYIGNPIGSKRTVLDFVYTGVFDSDTTFYANLMHNNANSITLYTYARIINIPQE